MLCDNSYIGLTTRQLKKRIKEHITFTCIDKLFNLSKKEKKKKYNKIIKQL